MNKKDDSPQQEILARLAAHSGDACFYYENLVTGDTLAYGADTPLVAASVIKLPVLIEAFRRMREGTLSPDESFVITQADKLPSCGALSYLHDGVQVTLLDLCTLMIILSDNTATNLLIKRLGMEGINKNLRALGARTTTLRRLLFDSAASGQGIENYITAREMGSLLKQLYHGEIVSAQDSAAMLEILKKQRLNGKIPFYLHGVPIAHKTGEDDGITHDVGIVYARQPFVVCFCGAQVQVPEFERTMQDIARILYEICEKSL
ncbi:MAG: serine hydrolase [Ruthenibacterium sp.]